MKSIPLDEPLAAQTEWPGVRRAMEEVNKVQHKLHDEGMSQVSFFFGVMNVGATGFILGRFPEYIWLLYAAKSAVLIPAWFYNVTKIYKGSLFVLDYCWTINILLSSYMVLTYFRGPDLNDDFRRYAFLFYYASAMGPLSWACLALHNGLIFHSIERTASLFIHFTPSMVAWTLRWYPKVVADAWPDRFPLHTIGDEKMHLFYLCGFLPYCAWLLLHSLWLLTIGVDCPKWGYETVFNDLYKKNKLADKWTKTFGTSNIRVHAAIYLAIHATCCSIAFLWAMLCYHFYWVHTMFSVLCFVSAAWYGSSYYNYLFTGIYTRALGKLIPSHAEARHTLSLEVLEHLPDEDPDTVSQTKNPADS